MARSFQSWKMIPVNSREAGSSLLETSRWREFNNHHHHQQQYHRHQLDHHRSPQKVRRDQRFSKHGHNLRIERVGPKDNGEYTCEVATIILIIVVFFIFVFIIDVFTEVKSFSFSSHPHYIEVIGLIISVGAIWTILEKRPSYCRWRRKTEIIPNLLLISKLMLIVMYIVHSKYKMRSYFWVCQCCNMLH